MDEDLTFEGDDLYSGPTEAAENVEEEEDDDTSMALRQTKQLRRFRWLFVFFVAVIAIGLSSTVYFVLSNQEDEAFEATFNDRSLKVADTLNVRIEQKIDALESFSVSTTSYASSKGLTWPFVTIPDFEFKGTSVRSLTQSVSLVLYPRVTSDQRRDWESYADENSGWIDDGLEFEEDFSQVESAQGERLLQSSTGEITTINDEGQRVPAGGSDFFFPAWSSSPVSESLVNLDLHSTEQFAKDIDDVWETREGMIGESVTFDSADATWQLFRESWEETDSEFYNSGGAAAKLYLPIFDVLEPELRQPVAIITSIMHWESFLHRILPPGQGGLDVVLENTCSQAFTYKIHGDVVSFDGIGDRHNSKFNKYKREAEVFENVNGNIGEYKGVPLNDKCAYKLVMYANADLQEEKSSFAPWVFAGLTLAFFGITTAIIFLYDARVERNYQETYRKAKQAGAIVSSIFPAAVRKRLYQEGEVQSASKIKGQGAFKQAVPTGIDAQKLKLKGFLNENGSMAMSRESMTQGGINDAEDEDTKLEKPIADLFPETSILFADIVGFTAWSSQREPGEVFMLLQNLFQEFDMIAKTLKVFKVETIGDCYVAATGLPEPQTDHAPRIAKFATKIMGCMIDVTRELEVRLGPDTGELRIRVGIHSGPVTAGVLRGNKARFQLFGDTMNFAARMEHHSLPNRIQCSEATADLLIQSGREHWIRPREDKVEAKGKGELQTYWIMASGENSTNNDSDVHTPGDEDFDAGPWNNTKLIFDLGTPGNRYQRLIDWNVELLGGLLKNIEAQRRDLRLRTREVPPSMELQGGSTALDEVTEIITLPQFNTKTARKRTKPEDVELSVEVITQLRDYVTTIASMYRDNSFHNFEHASHVTMSTNKLLKRVTVRDAQESGEVNAMDLHDYTYGITSDPLTQFTLVFCALVHDVDHAGVSNFQLIQEGATIAKLYKNKSVAEQNSVDLAWDLLMDPNYKELQKAIYGSEDELKRFRQLMVNIVLATDIFDVDMKAIRERRWGKAFQYDENEDDEYVENQPVKALQRDYDTPLSNIEGANLKATIVMEHLIQASDVAHTMQHWQIYLKWNERLFNEMYSAYENGRATKDPSVGWYEGEIMFFDKYIIPLAKKLDDCGVFGVASDECLNYAAQNRKQWALEGDEIVEGMIKRYHEKKAESGSRRRDSA